MVDYAPFYASLRGTQLESWLSVLPAQVDAAMAAHGDQAKWNAALAALPDLIPSSVDLVNAVRIGSAEDCDDAARTELRKQLMQLHPWRKGPFELFGMPIDTEWRSDWKWDRLKDDITPLKNRRVLDVGCGNGYHCWRMLGAGAKQVIGIDPFIVFVMQFWALRKFIAKAQRGKGAQAASLNELLSQLGESQSATVLPIGIEALPDEMRAFDTVFSMGVLYHRRSPFDHLYKLRNTLRQGGELVLETLVIDGKLGEVLVPEGRYAQMRNVWFLPSALTLESWLKKAKYRNVKLIDVTTTSTSEQRTTDWMTFNSLPDFLHPDDNTKTAEGHPAPMRAVFTAEAP